MRLETLSNIYNEIRWEIHKTVYVYCWRCWRLYFHGNFVRIEQVYVEKVVRFVLFARYSFHIIDINMSYVSKFESFTGEYFTIY